MLKPVSVNSGIWQVVAYIIKILITVKRKTSTQEEREETRESVLSEQEKIDNAWKNRKWYLLC